MRYTDQKLEIDYRYCNHNRIK